MVLFNLIYFVPVNLDTQPEQVRIYISQLSYFPEGKKRCNKTCHSYRQLELLLISKPSDEPFPLIVIFDCLDSLSVLRVFRLLFYLSRVLVGGEGGKLSTSFLFLSFSFFFFSQWLNQPQFNHWVVKLSRLNHSVVKLLGLTTVIRFDRKKTEPWEWIRSVRWVNFPREWFSSKNNHLSTTWKTLSFSFSMSVYVYGSLEEDSKI